MGPVSVFVAASFSQIKDPIWLSASFAATIEMPTRL
jgi:hypothetical protein